MSNKSRDGPKVVPLFPPKPALTMEEMLKRIEENYRFYDDDGNTLPPEAPDTEPAESESE